MVDIFHPLAGLHWQECKDLATEKLHAAYQCVLFRERLYVAVRKSGHIRDSLEAFLYFCSTQRYSSDNVWTPVTNTPSQSFALTVYHSELVLVGGIEVASGRVTDRLWTARDDDDLHWASSLPPMPTRRFESAAVSAGSPEALIVAGGLKGRDVDTSVVEVLSEGQWWSVAPLPVSCHSVTLTVHGGDVYLGGCTLTVISRFLHNFLFYSTLDSILGACGGASSGREGGPSGGHDSSVWKQSFKQLSKERLKPTPFSFGEQLLAVGEPLDYFPFCNKVYAFSTSSESWIHVADLPSPLISMAVVVLPTGELIVIGMESFKSSCKVFRGHIEKTSLDLEGQFPFSALTRLEEAGIHVVSTVAPLHKELAKITTGAQVLPDDLTRKPKWKDKEYCLEVTVGKWLSGSTFLHQPRHPNWKMLFQILKELDLKELSEQIKECLSGVRSLKELSSSVIVTALLCQEDIGPDQVHSKLPPYVPPTLKRSLCRLMDSQVSNRKTDDDDRTLVQLPPVHNT